MATKTQRFCIQLDWSDAPHLTQDQKDKLWAAIPPHQRDARTRGIPVLGSGVIYPVAEADIICQPFEFPYWYRRVYALDVGWNRTAALWAALDPETDTAYLYSEYYRGEAEPPIHAQAIKSRGEWIPGVVDPASRGRTQTDGQQLLRMYQDLDLNLTVADNSVESGIYEVWSRLSTGKLKVFPHLSNWLSEFRMYRRDEKGKIVKVNDHLMDTTRYLCMSGLNLAAQIPKEEWKSRAGGRGGTYQSARNPLDDMYGKDDSAERRRKMAEEPWRVR